MTEEHFEWLVRLIESDLICREAKIAVCHIILDMAYPKQV
jgi:hypothetical protein